MERLASGFDLDADGRGSDVGGVDPIVISVSDDTRGLIGGVGDPKSPLRDPEVGLTIAEASTSSVPMSLNCCADDPTSFCVLADGTDETVTSGTEVVRGADVMTRLTSTDDPERGADVEGNPMSPIHRSDDDPTPSRLHTGDPMGMIKRGVAPPNDEDLELPSGNVFASSSSSSSGSRAFSDESDDEDMFIEVEQTKKDKKVTKKAKVKVRPDPPGSSLSDEKSLRHLRKKCGISEEIVLPVKPSFPEVSKEFVTAMHTELSSGNDNWRKSFSRRRIERALSAELSGKDSWTRLDEGELAEFCRLSAERARISSAKGKGVDRETPSKRQRVDTYPVAVVGRETSANHVGGLLRDEAYSAVKSKAFELSLFFDRLVGDYDDDVRSRDSELGAAKEANAALQSRLDELAKRNKVLERDAQKVKKDYDHKLTKLKLRCTKAEGEVVQLRGELNSASDLQRSRGKVHNDMFNLAEIDANLEFIGLLQRSELPDLPNKVKALRERRHPIYDAHDVFVDLLANVRRVLEIPEVFAGAAEASVALNDDVVVTDEDEDDVEVTDDDEDAED
ncbi:hypothetical protein AALP_AA8G270500 [Arabis alpina]|uniref:Uncharacterized protein n=1 Tax=Arabis alpina TaxID=50452 RepID=A0A087G9Q4_ARAAL|nr:hypothetical protein AALP_AA8G270500 [Arabis alpina]